MEPKDYFKKKIIGQLITRKIDRLSLEGVPASIEDEKQYDIIDVIKQDKDMLFVTNTWENKSLNVVLAIHHNFVKETSLDV